MFFILYFVHYTALNSQVLNLILPDSSDKFSTRNSAAACFSTFRFFFASSEVILCHSYLVSSGVSFIYFNSSLFKFLFPWYSSIFPGSLSRRARECPFRRAFGSWLSQCRDLLLEPFPMFLVLSVFWSAIPRFYLELCCCEKAKKYSFVVYVYEIGMQVRQKYWRLNNPPFGIGWFSKIVRYKGFQAICLRSNMLMHFWDPQERCNSKKFKQSF